MKYIEVKFNVGGDALDLLAAILGDIGFEAFDGPVGYIQESLWDERALREAIAEFPMEDVHIDYDAAPAEDKDWNEAWESEGWEPNTVGHICIHDGRHLPAEPAELMIEIDARQAFGTACHPTTRMMLAELQGMAVKGRRVLDCGTGTGVLAIAAAKLGAALVDAYDIDQWSADNARHNATINGVGEDIGVWLGDSSTIRGSYDIVVANIFREVLLADLPAFARALAPGGTLLLSGFYEADIEALETAAAKLGLRKKAARTDDGWAALALAR